MTRISAASSNISSDAFSLPDPVQTPPTNAVTPHHHRRHHRHVHGHHGHHGAEQQIEEQHHHHKRTAQLAKRVRRPRTGKRSGAGSPEEPVTDSTFEELLLMLEEHARKVEPLVIGLSARQGQNDDDDRARDHRSTQGRRALLLQYLQEQAAESHSATTQKTAVASAEAAPADALLHAEELSGYARLEQELLAVRHAMQAGHPMPLRMAFDILRSYLQCAPVEGTPATLLAVKDRLLATTSPQRTSSPLSDREKTFNLLFPLLLLSPSRPRIGREQGESIARSSALARRWTTELWSYRAGLGLALPPLTDPSLHTP
ncbi:hypothetical protein R1479_03148 [Ralstonia mannitolilytica]|uniref:type III secretion protein HrpV n=1 Tax=Ralstonia mannitolilytica TaxID=105219 RepID=UPI0028F5C9E2|nr:type III secretion protein HrpV [Ralstonia mannitolilytica]CAJ0886119.1 hypothetical protein R1479_03148 [Ralstonia mannitolilytica]